MKARVARSPLPRQHDVARVCPLSFAAIMQSHCTYTRDQEILLRRVYLELVLITSDLESFSQSFGDSLAKVVL
jgi:hypothetical protein